MKDLVSSEFRKIFGLDSFS